MGTCLVNSGEPRAGVEQLLKILSLLPDNEENADKVNTQTLYYNLGIGLAYVGEWSTCFSVLGTNFFFSDVIVGKIASYDVSTLIINGTFNQSSGFKPLILGQPCSFYRENHPWMILLEIIWTMKTINFCQK